MQKLYTPRLVLRHFRETDLADIYQYASQPNVGPNAGWPVHTSIETTRAVLGDFIQNGEVWAIELRETGRVIGSIGLHPDKKRSNIAVRMLGYALSEDYWGQGLMSEATGAVLHFAFETLHLTRVSVYHYDFNNRSKRVIEKCGFVYEGILREATILPNGSIADDVCYSLSREEYYARLSLPT